MSATDHAIPQISTGVDELDELLRGGMVKGRMYLASGEPGTGKTTLGMQFLEEGLRNDETVLYIHGEESSSELAANAAQFDIDIADAEFLDLGPESDFFTDDPSYDLVNPQDIEERRYTQAIYEAVTEIDPDRIIIDPLTQLRYVEASEYHYRKRILSFIRFLKEQDVTVLATVTIDPNPSGTSELRSLSDGVITFTRTEDGRRIEVEKNRGRGQIEGTHGLEIRSQGLEVFPKVRPQPSDRPFDPKQIHSGIDELDALVGGGFERGTVTFISGPPGVGKTTLGAVYATQAAEEYGRSVIYLFEERIETFVYRCRSLGIPVEELRERGLLSIQAVEPLALSAEEFAHMVRHEVEEEGAETVFIDGIGGYVSAIQGEEDKLDRELHALTRYLVNREVSVFVTDAIHQITGISAGTSRQISPIADNLMFLSYVELQGSLRKVIGVLKKRAGRFEHTLREFEIAADEIRVGAPMTNLSGILRGTAEPSDDRPADGGPDR